VELTTDDLKLALDGKFVTRVIYLEDPHNALPAHEDLQSQHWFEAAPGQDPLAIADTLGRPVAILRLGGRLPESLESPDASFFFDSPPFAAIAAEPNVAPHVRKQAEKPRGVDVPPSPDALPAPSGRPVEAPAAVRGRSAPEGQKP
jgi:hypothetical protein